MSKNKSKEKLVKNSHYAQQGNDWEKKTINESINETVDQIYILLAAAVVGAALIVMCL